MGSKIPKFVFLFLISVVVITSLLISKSLVFAKQNFVSHSGFETQVISPRAKETSNEVQNKQNSLHSAVRGERVVVLGIPIWKASINLNDPETMLVIVQEDEIQRAGGLNAFVRINRPALVSNSTFKDEENRVWTMISEGRVLEGAESMNWSTGSVLGLRSNNQPEMMNRVERAPWNEYWFALTSNPRLVTRSQFASQVPSPELDRRPMQRSAIGFSNVTKTLYYVVTDEGQGAIHLNKLAEIMKEIGCDEAMNLEGGDGVLLAVNGTVYLDDQGRIGQPPRAPVIVVYDAAHPPPDGGIRRAWQDFQALHGS